MPAPDYAIDAVQSPLPAVLDVWHLASAPPLTITYAFDAQQSPDFLHSYTGWSPWTADQKEAVRWALHEYESVINVQFVEVAAGTDPDLAFGRVATPSTTAETWRTISYSLNASGQVTSKSWDSGTVFDTGVDLASVAARWLILHEIGHAMLMKHTGNYDSTGATPSLPYLPEAEDNRDYTVMSYVLADNAAVSRQLQLYDIAALQARWGANTHEAAGDNVYSFADDPGIFAIWDTGGIDRIDASAATGPADINLAEGAFSQLGGQNRMSIAWGAQIEDATGGASADRIRGNDLNNHLSGGAGADELYGGPGHDSLTGGAGANFLRGEAGDDYIVGGSDTDDSHGNMGNDTIAGGDGDDWVVGGKDQDLLYGDGGWDIVYGNLGEDTCEGGDGADWVRGGQGNDIVRGNAGDDFMAGDRGDDTLTGGAGADIFHIFGEAGLDRVLDFNAAEGDRVNLLAGSQYDIYQLGSDTIIALAGGAQMVLVGVQLSTLPSGWLFVG